MSRIYQNFPEAFEEIKRDLAEMGRDIRTTTVQDKVIIGNDAYQTRELMNYMYTVVDAKFEHLSPVQPWADNEWVERMQGIAGHNVNPGEAWKYRTEDKGDIITWSDFLEIDGKPVQFKDDPKKQIDDALVADKDLKFSYTYAERFSICMQVQRIITRLVQDRNSRQLYIGMWVPGLDSTRLGKRRVPCSLGWHFLHREGELHMTYFMRSCEFATHFQNDVYLSLKLQDFVADAAGLKRGRFTHFMSSLHCYNKNLVNVY